MPTENPKCLRCDVEMEEGFPVYESRGMYDVVGNRKVHYWVPGEPKFGLFGGLDLGGSGYVIKLYRCPKCSRLEPFAPENGKMYF